MDQVTRADNRFFRRGGELRQLLRHNGFTMSEMAVLLGCSRQTVYRKLEGSQKLTLGEVAVIAEVNNLSDEQVWEWFLSDESSMEF